MKRAALLALMLAACGSEQAPAPPPDPTGAGAALEQAAIARGVVPDPEAIQFAGRYERRSDLGTDRFCAVPRSDGRYNVGVLAIFGAGSSCEGQGEARRDGDAFVLQLKTPGTSADACTIRADYDGVELRLSGAVPQGCAALCESRASLAGTSFYMVEPGAAAARTTLGDQVDRLCT